MNYWTSLSCRSPGTGGTSTASTMPAPPVTSTSLSTVAPAGLMAAPVPWQVRLVLPEQMALQEVLMICCKFILHKSRIYCSRGLLKWESILSKGLQIKCSQHCVCASFSSPFLCRPYQHKAGRCMAIGLHLRPTRGWLCWLRHLSWRRPWRGVGVCTQTWHPWRDLQQLPGYWPA